MKNKENIFSTSRITVNDDGFSEALFHRIDSLPASSVSKMYAPPSKRLYRIPTLISAVAGVIIVVVLSLSGMDNVIYARVETQVNNMHQVVEHTTHKIVQRFMEK